MQPTHNSSGFILSLSLKTVNDRCSTLCRLQPVGLPALNFTNFFLSFLRFVPARRLLRMLCAPARPAATATALSRDVPFRCYLLLRHVHVNPCHPAAARQSLRYSQQSRRSTSLSRGFV